MNNNKKIIIGVLALLVVITMGYALFSETVTIGGTAKGTGNLDVIFESAYVFSENGASGTKVSISSDKKNLIINDVNLHYPGATVTIKYKIKNNESIPAVFSRKTTNLSEDELFDNAISATSSVKNVLYLEPGEIREDEFNFTWQENDGESPTYKFNNINADFGIVYNQANDKIDACDKLDILSNKISEAVYNDSSILDEYDINGDSYTDNVDATMVKNFMYQNLHCPNMK